MKPTRHHGESPRRLLLVDYKQSLRARTKPLFSRTLVLFLPIVLLLSGATQNLQAQQDPIYEQGFKPYSSFEGGDVDTVNLLNGMVNLHIPLVSYPQRGGKLHLGLNVLYAANIFQPFTFQCATGTCYSYSFQGGGVNPEADFGFSLQRNFFFPFQAWAFSADGSRHELDYLSHTAMFSIDGTAYGAPGPPSITCPTTDSVTDRNGVLHTFGCGPGPSNSPFSSYQDLNGNTITENISGGMFSFTDTLNRTINLPSLSPQTQTSDFTGCTGTLPTSSAFLWNLPALGGGTTTYKLCYATVTKNVPDICHGARNCSEPGAQSGPALQTLVLPNGKSWIFQYDSADPNNPNSGAYGDLLKITFPTGGSLSYTWQSNVRISGCSSSPRGEAFLRAVKSRTLDANDGQGPHTWTYTFSLTASGWLVTVQDPLLNQTLHTFSALPDPNGANGNSCAYYETQTQHYQGAQTGGTLLQTVATSYIDAETNTGSLQNQNGLPNIVTMTWANGQQKKIETDYEFPIATSSNAFSSGNVLAKREFDYGAASPTRTTNFSYWWQFNNSYESANIWDIPCLVTVYGPGGTPQQTSCTPPAVQANQTGQTIYGYDENNGSPQGTFGKQTSVTRWLNVGTSPKSQTLFNTQGMPTKQIDPMSHTTMITYDSTGLFPSQIQYPPTSGVAHNEGFSYDANTGLLNSHTDQNSQTTSYGYDSLQRVTSINYPPSGGQTTFCYTDEGGPTCATASAPPFKVVATKQITGGTNLVTAHVFDGLGRLKQTQRTSDPDGLTFRDTTYDALGRVYCVSNPYRSIGDATYGITTHLYDAIGRLTAVQRPDYWSAASASSPTCQSVTPQTTPANPTNYISTMYSGNATTVTDQSGKARKAVTDGLGRLTQVVEDPSVLKYETDYTYDALDNLTCVAQKGTNTGNFTNCASTPAAWRPRAFRYDSLSRLTSSSNPESNTVPATGATLATTYIYDANGNLTYKTSPAPNQASTATVTLTFCYDALSRLTAKGYTLQTCTNGNLPTPAATYSYDQGPSGANPVGRRTGMTDAAGSSIWRYDSMGRPTIQQRTTNGVAMTTAYTYNLDGSTATLTYPSGRTITYTPGGAGRPLSAMDQDNGINYAQSVSYSPQGALSSVVLGQTGTFGGISLNQGYNPRLQPASIRGSSTNGVALDLGYCFYSVVSGVCQNGQGSNNGNVTRIVNNRDTTRTQNFTYDSLNRIFAAYSDGNLWGETFSIDAWGNLNQISTYAGKPQAENLNQLAGPNNRFIATSYDAPGNLLNDGASNYSYDAENRIATGASVTYTYDGDGNRVQKSSGKLYWFGMDGNVLDESDSSGNITDEYVFFGGARIASQHGTFSCPGLTSGFDYHLADQLGSARVVTDSSGNRLDDADFFPFGGERDAIPRSSGNNYRFTGKERDSESGLDNFGARYFTSTMGRFASPDEPLLDQQARDPQSWNLYSYARNNPLNNTDPSGEACVSINGGPYRNDDSGGQSCEEAAQPQEIRVGLTDDERIRLIFSMTYDAATDRNLYIQGAQDATLIYAGYGAGRAAWELPGLVRTGLSLLTSLKFDEAVIDAVIKSSEREVSSQITAGAKALAKKAGHAAADGAQSAFDGIARTQEGAGATIRDIMSKPARVVRGGRTTDIYNAAGQGVRIQNGTNKFIGFLEGSKASR